MRGIFERAALFLDKRLGIADTFDRATQAVFSKDLVLEKAFAFKLPSFLLRPLTARLQEKALLEPEKALLLAEKAMAHEDCSIRAHGASVLLLTSHLAEKTTALTLKALTDTSEDVRRFGAMAAGELFRKHGSSDESVLKAVLADPKLLTSFNQHISGQAANVASTQIRNVRRSLSGMDPNATVN